MIPQQATFEILDKKYVYVVDEKNIVSSREIKIGTEIPHLYEVLDGLTEADKIIVEGLRKVKNKQEIKYALVKQEKVIAELNRLHAE